MLKLKKEDRYKSGIYCIENTINNKKYIGQSKNIYQRISTHNACFKYNSKKENQYLLNSVNKYGIENFKYYVLVSISEYDENLLKQLELHYMKKYNVTNSLYGYNCKEDNSNECNIVRESTKNLNRLRLKERYSKFTKKELNDYYLKIANSQSKYYILKCDINRNIIKQYSSRKEINQDHPDFKLSSISSCCSGYKNTYKGFIWIYKNKSDNYIHYDKLKIIKFLQYTNRKI